MKQIYKLLCRTTMDSIWEGNEGFFLLHDLIKNPSKRALKGVRWQPASQVMTAAPKSSVTRLQTLRSHLSCLQEGKEQPPSLRSMRQTQNTPSALLRMIDDSLAAEVCDI